METTATLPQAADMSASPAFVRALRRKLLRIPASERFLRRRHREIFGRALGTEPGRLTEKLFRRMIALNRRPDPLLTRLADKFAAREWVAERVGEDILSTLLWHGTAVDSVPFRLLPERCVIKTNHGSGQILVKDGGLDEGLARAHLARWLATNYFWSMREAQYLHIEPRILVEEFLPSDHALGLLDYRFWCFDGRVEVVQVDDHAHSICPFYDTQWRKLDLSYRPDAREVDIARPAQLERMLEIASRLSRGIPFVRVDLYDASGRIVFGEMTFTPAAGNLRFPSEWDLRLGAAWR